MKNIFVVLAFNEIHTDPALDLSSHCEIYTWYIMYILSFSFMAEWVFWLYVFFTRGITILSTGNSLKLYQ